MVDETMYGRRLSKFRKGRQSEIIEHPHQGFLLIKQVAR